MLSDRDFNRMVQAGVMQSVIEKKMNKGFKQHICRFKGAGTGTKWKQKYINPVKGSNLPLKPTKTPSNESRTLRERY